MFRYIALAWNESHPAHTRFAHQLSNAWRAREDWHVALMRPGLHVFTTGVSAGINEAHAFQGGLGIVLGRLFRRHPDLTRVRTERPTFAEETRILQTGGQFLTADFWGRYIAFLQTARGTTQVLRDPSGTLPCFYIQRDGVTVLFSWLEDALQMRVGAAPLRIGWDALTAQLISGGQSAAATALEEVRQVLPGEIIDLNEGSSSLQWNAVDIAGDPVEYEFSEAARRLGDTVRHCVRAWADCYDTLLLRLSGGVDSSIVISCLAPGSTSSDVLAVNYHSPGSDSDERAYARLAASRAGRDLVERERDPKFQLERVFQIARMPDPVPYIGWMNAETDARLACAHGASAMFTGAGGDAVFYEFPRWWPAADYLKNHGLDTGFAGATMDAARLGKISLWSTLGLVMKQRLQRNHSEAVPTFHGLLAPDLVADASASLDRFRHPALRHAQGLPIGKSMQTAALMSPIGYYDPFEQARAAELVNPLLSQPIVELCLRLPTYLLAHGGRGRALARRAFASHLPPQIVNRRSKGGMEERIRDVLDANIEQIRSLLLDGVLARRGMLDRVKLEELLSGRPTTLAGPVSEIHALAAVEAWLARWAT